MKIIKYTAGVVMLSGVASAQGLFDVNPNETEYESSPLRYTAGVNFGYDDNVNPTSGRAEEDSAYVNGTLGANLVVRGPRTSWDVNATVGATHYLETISTDDTTYNARIAFNLNHRINNQLRYVTRNFFNYGLDLGTFYGPITDRQLEEYVYFSTDHAIGYRWTDRLATYTGVTYSTLAYDNDVNDVDSLSFYNTFRYSLSPQTVLTATYRYTNSEFGTGVDRSSQYATVGIEQQLTPTSSITVDAGAQFSSGTSPYVQMSYTNRINNQLKARVYARYAQEDVDSIFPVGFNNAGRYNDKTTLRVGAAFDYTLSPQVTLTVGGNYTQSDYEDGTNGLQDGDADLFNAYASVAYSINEALSLSASINHTTSDASASIPNRDYDRNRYQVGVNYTF